MAAYQGTYYTAQFQLANTDGTFVNISGWAFKAEFRVQLSDVDPLLTLTTGNTGFSIISASTGLFQMVLTAVQTLALPVGGLVFDVLRTDASPGPVYLFGGVIRVKEPVTR